MTAMRIPPPAWQPPGDDEPEWTSLQLADGYATPLAVHRPPTNAAGPLPVVYLHGIQSHPGWFYRSARALAEAGHTVYQPTRRGSGANLADHGHARSAGQLLDDLGQAIELARRECDAPACHLLGVSWGGKLALAYAAERPGEALASLTLVAPGLCPQVDVGVGAKLAIGVSLLCCPRRHFDIPLNQPELFTDHPAMREYLQNDAGRLHQATARFLYVSRCLDRRLRKARNGAVGAATRLLLASRDRIIDNAATRELCERLCGERLVVKELDGAHTLEFEPRPEAFLTAVCEACQSEETVSGSGR
jgi:alpha-beta hydrolase superfamily lysophospholipase